MKKNILGIDFGTVRIGLAISDLLGITAQGMETLKYTDDRQVIEHIREIVTERAIGEIVMGLPLNMNGTKGPAAERCEAFGEQLQKAVGVPVKFWDERLTSVAAEKQMLKFDLSRRKRRKAVDRMAAQILLQSYMDSMESKEAERPET